MAKQSFSDQIRQAILNSDLTRYQISQQTGIDQAALSRFVHGERGLALDNVDLIAELLGLEVTQKKAK